MMKPADMYALAEDVYAAGCQEEIGSPSEIGYSLAASAWRRTAEICERLDKLIVLLAPESRDYVGESHKWDPYALTCRCGERLAPTPGGEQ